MLMPINKNHDKLQIQNDDDGGLHTSADLRPCPQPSEWPLKRPPARHNLLSIIAIIIGHMGV